LAAIFVSYYLKKRSAIDRKLRGFYIPHVEKISGRYGYSVPHHR